MSIAATMFSEITTGAAQTATAAAAVESGQPPFTISFASLLATEGFVQEPGYQVFTDEQGMPILAAFETMTGVGGTVGEGGPVDALANTLAANALEANALEDGLLDPLAAPGVNMVALLDTTSLGAPSSATQVLGLDLGAPSLGGAVVDGADMIPASAPLAAVAAAPTKPPVVPVKTLTDGLALETTDDGLPLHKGVTAADLVAEIAHLNPDGTVPPDSPLDQAAPPAAPRQGTVTAAPSSAPSAEQAGPVVAAAAPGVTTALPMGVVAAAAASPAPIAQPVPAADGDAPDGDPALRAAQTGAVRLPSPINATVTKPGSKTGAKTAADLTTALRGDVALAAMAEEAPRPGPPARTAPVSATAPTANPDASQTGQSGPSGGQATVAAAAQTPVPSTTSVPTAAPVFQPVDASTQQTALQATQDVTPEARLEARLEGRPETISPASHAARAPDAAVPALDRTAQAPPAPPAEQVALQLRHALVKGLEKINIQLSPASLGTIDVTLDLASGSRVTAHVVVDRADTLDLLRADSRGLERALQDAGLRTDQGSLNFSLRGDGSGGQQQHSQNSAAPRGFDDPAPGGGEADHDAIGEHDETPAQQASNGTLNIEV